LDQQQVVERLDDAVQAVVSGLSDEQISQLADELGLSIEGVEAILRDPAFAGVLKAEAVKLAAG
jgi:predicted xylose isomerase-like sugar epimerase